MELLDIKSIVLCLISYFGLLISKTDITFMLTAGVTITTMLYNLIRIFKSLKRK